MSAFAIVIVAKNSEDKIGRLLKSLQGLSDEIIVCDTGSTDNTIGICKDYGATVHEMPWEGYGTTKRKASAFANKDWILSFDSDEEVSADLYRSLKNWKAGSDDTVYQLLWKTYLGDRWIKYSDWGHAWKNRLYNRKVVNWDDAIAHEDLRSKQPIRYQKINGCLNHYSFLDIKDYATKMVNSALLRGKEYHLQGKRAKWYHTVFSPLFTFFKCYIIKLGFLDGYYGWIVSRTSAYYTLLKYAHLEELNKQNDKQLL